MLVHVPALMSPRWYIVQIGDAAAAQVRHVIWSTAEDTRQWYAPDDDRMPTLPGGYKVPNWDGKGESDQLFAATGVPTTYRLTPFHWEAFVFGFGAPQLGPDGIRTLAMPLGEAVLIAAEDIGRCAYPMFQDRAQFVGTTVGIASEHLTGDQLAAGLTDCSANPCATSTSLPRSSESSHSRSGPRRQHVPVRGRRQRLPNPARHTTAKTLNPTLIGFTEWVASTSGRVPVEV